MIQRDLATMDHVELLSVLRGSRETSFSPAQLAERVRKPEQQVGVCLRALVSSGLVAELPEARYRYAAEKDVDRTAESVIALYNERPVTLVRLLYDRQVPVNTFAQALKLRKDA